MKKLYKFYWDCGRSGSVEGMFIADEKTIENVMGSSVYFGEILGKYSEVYGTLEEEDLTIVEVSDITVKEMEDVIGSDISGCNPLNYLRLTCNRCDETSRAEEMDFYIDDNDKICCEECVTEEEAKRLERI